MISILYLLVFLRYIYVYIYMWFLPKGFCSSNLKEKANLPIEFWDAASEERDELVVEQCHSYSH